MKGDFSRPTFDPARHYAGVRMQQGRVQLDADWNEQGDIVRHRGETGMLDVVGRCGGPLHASAFGVTTLAELSAAEKAYVEARWPGFVEGGGDFLLSAGRYYVDGILVENEHPVPFTHQPDLPGLEPLGDANHLLYLDVWERHLTALEASWLREIALGGPDTATRTRVVWQVRSLVVAESACSPVPGEYGDATAPSTGRLRMRASADQATGDPCVVPPGSGYRGLENQLYRVEIHDGGAPVSHTGNPGWAVASAAVADRRLTLAAAPGAIVGRAVELYHATGSDPAAGTVAYVVEVSGTEVTLAASFDAPDMAAGPRLRLLDATAKWSRDNGVVVARVISVSGVEVVVESFGVDDVLSIQGGDWVEIFDDSHELAGTPGSLYQVASRNDATRTLVLRVPATPLGPMDGVDPALNPRIRRWDGLVAVKTELPGDGYAELESGVQLRWEDAEGAAAGVFHTGDWWNAPARTATAESQSGTLEWPQALDGDPEARRATGIVHHYCRLGIVQSLNGTVKPLDDCRCFFAPATELNSLAYVSGAGQEAMPDLASPGERVELKLPLVVGVPNAHCRDQPASVRFTVLNGGGSLSSAANTASALATIDVPLGPDGLAQAWWWMGTANPTAPDTLDQRVRARLLENGAEVQLPVIFNASLSVAHRVSYDPGLCDGLSGQFTVQKAIDRLAHAASLFAAGGDGGEVMPGKPLARRPRVMLASDCGPLSTKNSVEWIVRSGSGKVGGSGSSVLTTPVNGFADVLWELDATTPYQELEARINPKLALPSAEPTSVFFSATLSTADQVAFDPGEECGPMRQAGVDTVEEALRWFCQNRGGGGGCSVSVGEGGDFPTLAAALKLLEKQAAVNVCLLPGTHQVTAPIRLDRHAGTVRITGSGDASEVRVLNKGGFRVGPLGSFVMRDVTMLSGVSSMLQFEKCSDVVLEHCFVSQESVPGPMITVAAARTLRIAGCTLHAERPDEQPGRITGGLMKLNDAFVKRMRDVRAVASATTATILDLGGVKMPPLRGGGERGGVNATQQRLPTGAGRLEPAPRGDVLALLDAGGTSYLEDNVISGYVWLYGRGAALGLEALHSLIRAMKQAQLPEGGGTLFMRGNLCFAVRLDASVTDAIPTRENTAARMPLRSSTLAENSFFEGWSQVLAASHTVSGNQWTRSAFGDLLMALGMSATVSANTAAELDNVQVYTAVRPGRTGKGANLVQLIEL